MFCPSCTLRLEESVNVCPSCGFTGAQTMQMYHGTPPPMMEIMDLAGVWTDEEKNEIQKKINKLRSLFPQVHWSILSVVLPPETNLRTFAFWVFNASPLSEGQTAETRQWTIFLLVEPDNHRITVLPGYCIEPFLSDDQWQKAVWEMKKFWHEKSRGEGVLKFLNSARIGLIEASKRANHIISTSSSSIS